MCKFFSLPYVYDLPSSKKFDLVYFNRKCTFFKVNCTLFTPHVFRIKSTGNLQGRHIFPNTNRFATKSKLMTNLKPCLASISQDDFIPAGGSYTILHCPQVVDTPPRHRFYSKITAISKKLPFFLIKSLLRTCTVVDNAEGSPDCVQSGNRSLLFPLRFLPLSLDWAVICNRDCLWKNLEHFESLSPIFVCFDDYTFIEKREKKNQLLFLSIINCCCNY